MQIVDRGNLRLSSSDFGEVIVEEFSKYTVISSSPPTYEGVPLSPKSHSASDRWVLDTSHAVGVGTLRAGIDELRLQIVPRSGKMLPDEWICLLEDIENWLPAVVVGADGPRIGTVGRTGTPLSLLVEALLVVVPQIVQAIQRLLESPIFGIVVMQQSLQLRRLRHLYAENIVWMSRHPTEIDLISSGPGIPYRCSHETLNHPANQYVVWLINRTVRALRDVARQFAGLHRALHDDAGWCENRKMQLEQAADSLESKIKCSSLQHVSPTPASEAAFVVIANDPVYGRIHRLCRLLLSPAFRLVDESPPSAPTRPSFGLYELWCLQAIGGALSQVFPSWQWKWKRRRRLFDIAGTGSGVRLHGESGGVAHIDLYFNLTFRGYVHRGESPHYSLSAQRRPDFVLRASSGQWLCVDAKYSSEAHNIAKALQSCHIYRDSLRFDGVPCTSCVITVPRAAQASQPWFEPNFRKENGFGGIEFRPGMTERISEFLGGELRKIL